MRQKMTTKIYNFKKKSPPIPPVLENCKKGGGTSPPPLVAEDLQSSGYLSLGGKGLGRARHGL